MATDYSFGSELRRDRVHNVQEPLDYDCEISTFGNFLASLHVVELALNKVEYEATTRFTLAWASIIK